MSASCEAFTAYTELFHSSVTGLLLAGVGHFTEPPDSQKNFLVVDQKTEKSEIAQVFNSFTKERKDIAIVLINQHVAEMIRDDVARFKTPFQPCLKYLAKIIPTTQRKIAY